jgi:FkbM family methyltransferase
MIRKIFAEKRWKRKYRRPARATMVRGLRWLSQSGIPIETVLDVGAAIGGWSKKCMDYFPTANYVLFEPNPGHHKALNEFARSSTSRNITIVEKAAGANEGTVPFVFDPDDLLSGAVTKESASSTIEVELTSIDSALSGLQTEPPFLTEAGHSRF